MSVQSLLQPNLSLPGTVLSLTVEMLQQHHVKGLVLDVDDTLVPFFATDASPDLLNWLATIRSIGPIWLVSNNFKEARIRRIAESLDLPYLAGARKPSRRKLRQAVEQMQQPTPQIAMVGDRLLTDVLAGNRLGMFTILVEPILLTEGMQLRVQARNFEIWLAQQLGFMR